MRVWWKQILTVASVACVVGTAQFAGAGTLEPVNQSRLDVTEMDTDAADAAVATKAATASALSLASSASFVVLPTQVTLTATVTGTTLKGNITFKSGAVTLGAAAINANMASIMVTLSAAIHSLTAVFVATGGDVASPPIRVIVDNALACG